MGRLGVYACHIVLIYSLDCFVSAKPEVAIPFVSAACFRCLQECTFLVMFYTCIALHLSPNLSTKHSHAAFISNTYVCP